MLNNEKTVRLVQDHVELEDSDYHEWVALGRMVRANVNGIPNPRMYHAAWAKVTCNNPDCPAWALVDVAWTAQESWPCL